MSRLWTWEGVGGPISRPFRKLSAEAALSLAGTTQESSLCRGAMFMRPHARTKWMEGKDGRKAGRASDALST